jgi:N-acetylneuraminate synthase
MWFASCWDIDSVDFIDQFNPPCYKIASPCLTDDELLIYTGLKGKPIILSTGMSTLEQIDHAVKLLDGELIILHCTSTYPGKTEELNLNVIPFLKDLYAYPIGYSGHEVGISTTIAAAVLGAKMVERHITLDRSMWGSDQSASVEPQGIERIVGYIHTIEGAIGDGVKKVYESELPIMKKLRKSL